MPTTATPQRSSPSRLLFLYADGGALRDLNDRFKSEETSGGDRRRLDFRQVPDMIGKKLREDDKLTTVDCPKDGRLLFQLGAASAGNFIEEMAAEWTVITVPLGMCRYDRNLPADRADKDGRVPFRVRFHALIAYHLGFLAGRSQSFSKPVTVAVISDDAQLLPAMADARQQGLDVRLVWPEATLPDETRYFAGRNGVPMLLIDAQLSSAGQMRSQVGYLDRLLKIGK